MKDATAIYLGKIVSKKNFRAYIYAPDLSQKLVESWDSYEKHMETGLWFPTKEDAQASLAIAEPEKPKRVRKPASVKTLELKEEPAIEDVEPQVEDSIGGQDLAFEVTNDDFLPKKASK
jgi:hypothetical protein